MVMCCWRRQCWRWIRKKRSEPLCSTPLNALIYATLTHRILFQIHRNEDLCGVLRMMGRGRERRNSRPSSPDPSATLDWKGRNVAASKIVRDVERQISKEEEGWWVCFGLKWFCWRRRFLARLKVRSLRADRVNSVSSVVLLWSLHEDRLLTCRS